ncbi:hypothetical protein FACUT_8882 [Fusarium acutatum]|uniref:Uncharacterized protein n=1 Tax=Fusarium acutatum TaxID=78861 RepID=A0A8H4JKQ3_9HYPO|nr:hypothetical protein FACUT_8882 [Fusarium acutatum]
MTASTTNPASEAPKKSDKKSDVSTTKPEASTKATVPAQDTKRQKKEGTANPISTFAAGILNLSPGVS